MKVIDALNRGKPTLSFEFFPPKTEEQEKHLFAVIAQLSQYKPDFVSVTYGAMGTTREKTFFWASEIKKRFAIEPVAHLTCVAAARDDIARQVDELEAMGIENILALRGDPPDGEKEFVPPADGFKYAKELIAFIKQRKPHFCLGAAGFPEGHPRAQTVEQDIEYLKQKIDAGADYVITQLFFDNRFFFDFTERCRQAGIRVPIIPGLMPITNLKQIQKITRLCGAAFPKDLYEKLEKNQHDPAAVGEIGAEHALAQSRELLGSGAPGLHFFVMNQAGPIAAVLDQLKLR